MLFPEPLNALPAEALAELEKLIQTARFPACRCIFKAGTPGESCFRGVRCASSSAKYTSANRGAFSTLIRLLGDFDLAEEAMHEAFAAALVQWPQDGRPANPRAWLISTGRHKAIDALRRRARSEESSASVAARVAELSSVNAERADLDIEDDRLRLVFTCCHPALPPAAQVAMTLREVCGLTTEQIAAAFLMAPAAVAQRIVRAKAKIRDARIPFDVPPPNEFPQRLVSVLTVIYLVFNEGYSPSAGDALTRPDLSAEAIRLGRLVLELAHDPEVMGLLALMLLHESRRTARATPEGDLILLENQDRSLWNRKQIEEAKGFIERALATRRFGVYTIQAGIAAVHADAADPARTDWAQIVGLYDVLAAVGAVAGRRAQPRGRDRHARPSGSGPRLDRCHPSARRSRGLPPGARRPRRFMSSPGSDRRGPHRLRTRSGAGATGTRTPLPPQAAPGTRLIFSAHVDSQRLHSTTE